jgi:hypothetical protein
VFIRELRKEMAAAKKKKALAASEANATKASDLVHNIGVRSEAQSSRERPQPNRKAEELSSSDCTSVPASRSPATGNLFDEGAAAQGSKGRTSCQVQPATRSDRGWACVYRGGNWTRGPTTAKWDTQAPSQGLRIP